MTPDRKYQGEIETRFTPVVQSGRKVNYFCVMCQQASAKLNVFEVCEECAARPVKVAA